MFKSIFTKYFAVVSLIVFVCFLVVGVVQTALSFGMLVDEKQALLTENALRLATTAAEDFRMSSGDDSRYVLDTERSRLPQTAVLLASALGADVLISDTRGVLLASAALPEGQLPSTVSAAALQRVEGKSGAFWIGSLDDRQGEQQYIAVAPIQKSDRAIGYVFITTPLGDLRDQLFENLRIYLLSAVFVLLCAFVVIYITTARLVRPLRYMSEAVRRFGNGDFSHRIPVKGKDEVAQLAHSLNQMAVSLSAAEDASRSFVANVSHELKTPMTTIGGFIDGILDGTVPPEKQSHYLGIVSGEVKRLSQLVRTMLDLSRIERDVMKITPRPFDLTEKMCHTLLSFEQRIEEKRLRVEGPDRCPPCEVNADADLIGQVLYNLIDNAVKFSDEGGTLTFCVRETPQFAECSVRNTGKGIPKEELPHIFERFYKSDKSRSMDKSGVGLGLFIVHSVLAMHGGDISVRSVENEYCEFCFRLPRETKRLQTHEKPRQKGHTKP